MWTMSKQSVGHDVTRRDFLHTSLAGAAGLDGAVQSFVDLFYALGAS